MNVDEIYRQVNRDISDAYNLQDIIDWVNRALDDLTPIAKKQAKVTLNSPYILDDTFHQVHMIQQGSNILNPLTLQDLDHPGFKIWDNTITLQLTDDTGPIDVYYYRKFKRIVAGPDVPELETEFHDLLILYCLGKAQFFDEDYEFRPDQLGTYGARKLEYEKYIEKRNRKRKVTEKVIW
jgi:hypothetical protein